jgi:hypothetical protein
LDPNKLRQLKRPLGPGTLSQVLRDTVQSLVDAALQTKQTFSILRTRQGDGDVVIRGKISQRIKPFKFEIALYQTVFLGFSL